MKSVRRTSPMWSHFEDFTQDRKAKCKYCVCSVNYSGGSSGNLLHHMKTKHITIPVDIQRESVPDDISVVGENAAAKSTSPLPSTSSSEASSSNNVKKFPGHLRT
ncbi:hypothetical protein AVEN_118794-1 [Araneus ventricosus]|uniref:BED-type domain-containing protein n=1 Tax=Araneus ventricosus TaxID=182803 RepID=A0A4Y2BXQ9_ARAVE|nr:hypothetical protein AVEN_118794-1 [Araneus ventricosus]